MRIPATWAGLLLVLLLANRARTDEIEPPTTAETETSAAPATVADDDEKQRTVAAAIGVLVGILLVGLLLLGATIVLGHRARRISREPLPERTPDDAFTHLRKGPDPVSGGEVPDATPGDADPDDSPS